MAHRATAALLLILLAVAAAAAESEEVVQAPERAKAAEELAGMLERLEEVADSLARSVRALESVLARSAEPDPPPPRQPFSADAPALGARDRLAPQGVAVTKRRPVWSERFNFVAAVRLGDGAHAAAQAALPYENADGLTKYFAVGDSRGRVFVFSAAGDALLELDAGESASSSPVTALLTYLSPRRTDCLLFAGHADGSIAAHRLTESSPHGDDCSPSSCPPPGSSSAASTTRPCCTSRRTTPGGPATCSPATPDAASASSPRTARSTAPQSPLPRLSPS
ncbi:hypothetical protein ACQ4PT_034263 [Festuca glaucescens]